MILVLAFDQRTLVSHNAHMTLCHLIYMHAPEEAYQENGTVFPLGFLLPDGEVGIQYCILLALCIHEDLKVRSNMYPYNEICLLVILYWQLNVNASKFFSRQNTFLIVSYHDQSFVILLPNVIKCAKEKLSLISKISHVSYQPTTVHRAPESFRIKITILPKRENRKETILVQQF